MLDVDLFKRVIDELGPSLGRVDFFNYGETFLHKQALEMYEYIKQHHPQIYRYTSTNGLALNEARARQPETLEPGQTSEVEIEIPLPTNRGRYRMKCDLANEGID